MSRFALAADHPLTAEAAAQALRSGGGAADACIAGALMACAVQPAEAGLFAAGRLLLREPGGRVRLLDFRARAPGRSLPERDLDFGPVELSSPGARRSLHLGPAAAAAPGLIPGLAEAHARFGRLPMRELAAPAIEAAARGAPLSPGQAAALARLAPAFARDPAAAALFLDAEGAPLAAGAPLRNPALADALDAFANEGPRLFQEGEITAMLAESLASGGQLGIEDIAAFRPDWVEPLTLAHGAARLRLSPGPSGVLTERALADVPRGGGAEPGSDAFPTEIARRLARLLLEDGEPPAPLPLGGTAIAAVDASGFAACLTLGQGAGCARLVAGVGARPNSLLGEAFPPRDGPPLWRPGARLPDPSLLALAEWPDGAVAALALDAEAGSAGLAAPLLARLVEGGEALDRALAAPRLRAVLPTPQAEEPPRGGVFLDHEAHLPEPARAALVHAFPDAREVPDFGKILGARRAGSGAADAAAEPRGEGASLAG